MTKKELAANKLIIEEFYGEPLKGDLTDYLQLVVEKLTTEYEYSYLGSIRISGITQAFVSIAQKKPPYNVVTSDKKASDSLNNATISALVQFIALIDEEDETQ